MINSPMSLRNMRIPLIVANKLIFDYDEEQKVFNFFYGIDERIKEQEAISVLNKINVSSTQKNIFFNVFKNKTVLENKKWLIQNECNVYENTLVTRATALLIDGKTDYEKVFWKCITVNQ